MLLKAIERFKATNPDISINVDYKGLERQIEPLNRHMERMSKNGPKINSWTIEKGNWFID